MGRDPIEYQSNTRPANPDTYERTLEEDVKQEAVEAAWAVATGNARDLLPRFAKDQLPRRPPETPSVGAHADTEAAGRKRTVKPA